MDGCWLWTALSLVQCVLREKNPERTANRGPVVLTLMVRLVEVMQGKAVQGKRNNPKHEAEVKQARRDGKKQKFAHWNAKKLGFTTNGRTEREAEPQIHIS